MGISAEITQQYLRNAGDFTFTKTHGRREVAFLNRAWDDVTALDYTVDIAVQTQPLLDSAVNLKASRCATVDGLGEAALRLLHSLERI